MVSWGRWRRIYLNIAAKEPTFPNNHVLKECDNLRQGRRRSGCDALNGDYDAYISAPIPDGRYPFIYPCGKREVSWLYFNKNPEADINPLRWAHNYAKNNDSHHACVFPHLSYWKLGFTREVHFDVLCVSKVGLSLSMLLPVGIQRKYI